MVMKIDIRFVAKPAVMQPDHEGHEVMLAQVGAARNEYSPYYRNIFTGNNCVAILNHSIGKPNKGDHSREAWIAADRLIERLCGINSSFGLFDILVKESVESAKVEESAV